MLLPKSMSGLVLSGFALVSLPLIAAVVFAVSFVDRLAGQSERLVQQGVQVAHYSAQLDEHLVAMERHARQYMILGDRALIDLISHRHALFKDNISTLEKLRLPGSHDWHLDQLGKDTQSIVQLFISPDPQPPVEQARLEAEIARFTGLRQLGQAIATQGNKSIKEELALLQKTSDQARQYLIWTLMMLIPLALMIVLLFTYLITRPTRQISHAIAQLGTGRFTEDIQIKGPPDEFKRMGDELNWLRQRLIQLEDERGQFLSHMSHELKTPLASIREGTELLSDGIMGDITNRQTEVLDIIRGSSLELQQMIENLLNFSAWQKSLSSMHYQNIDLQALCNSLLRRQQLTITAKNISCETKLKQKTITADRQRLHLALDNLISNAIKYAPEHGRIWIASAAIGDHLIVDIADNGPGISPEDERLIFEPFYQGKSAAGERVKGTGIGLSVVRDCIHAHHGTIAVIRGQYPGAHLRLSIPLKPEHGTDTSS